MRFFEDMEVGQRREFGSFTFTADGIKTFAAQFDPQPFHLDEAAGHDSLFGGLAASGWHVASVCMKLTVADAQRLARDAAARGETIAVWGPSPGFRELAGSGRCWLATPSVLPAKWNRGGHRIRGLNGGSCRSATPAPISAANWRFRYSPRPSCRGVTPEGQFGLLRRASLGLAEDRLADGRLANDEEDCSEHTVTETTRLPIHSPSRRPPMISRNDFFANAF